MLGVLVDLKDAKLGWMFVSNMTERRGDMEVWPRPALRAFHASQAAGLEQTQSFRQKNFLRDRQVSRGLADHVHIYVDESYQAENYCGVGGLRVSSTGDAIGFFNEKVPAEFFLLVQGGDKETVILELGMVAIS